MGSPAAHFYITWSLLKSKCLNSFLDIFLYPVNLLQEYLLIYTCCGLIIFLKFHMLEASSLVSAGIVCKRCWGHDHSVSIFSVPPSLSSSLVLSFALSNSIESIKRAFLDPSSLYWDFLMSRIMFLNSCA